MDIFSMDVFGIWNGVLEIGTAILTILGGASVIARFTPTKTDVNIIVTITRVLVHWLGLTKPDSISELE